MATSSIPLLPFGLPGARSPEATPQTHRPETLRAICFGVDGHRFALPVTAISKVAHCPSLDGNDLGKAGLIHIDSQVIQILDLRALLHPAPAAAPAIASEPLPEQFLVVAHCQGRSPVGIPTDAPPDLIEIPRAAVRPLPPRTDQRDRARLTDLAAFVAVLGSEGHETSIFLLDLARALAIADHQEPPP